MPQPPPAPDAFVAEQANNLYEQIKSLDETIAVELLRLNLKVAYQQGYGKGLSEGYKGRK